MQQMRNYYIFVTALGIFILVLLIIGFTGVSNPYSERERKSDEKRSSDIQSISNEIKSYYTSRSNTLPEKLIVPANSFHSINDPVTGKEYEYNKLSVSAFELCANFSTDTRIPTKPTTQ